MDDWAGNLWVSRIEGEMIIEGCEISPHHFENFPIIPEGAKYPVLCQDGRSFERPPTNTISFGETVRIEKRCEVTIEFFYQNYGPRRKIRISARRGGNAVFKSGIIGFDFCDMMKAIREWQRPDL